MASPDGADETAVERPVVATATVATPDARPDARPDTISLDSDDEQGDERNERNERDDDTTTKTRVDSVNGRTSGAVPQRTPLYEDEDLTIEGERGCVAGRDLPHLRHDCLVHPCDRSGFVFPSLSVPRLQSQGCPKCYCPVCDVPTSECRHRVSHHTVMSMLMPHRYGGSVELMRSLLGTFSFDDAKTHTMRAIMQHVTDPQHASGRRLAKYNTWYTRL